MSFICLKEQGFYADTYFASKFNYLEHQIALFLENFSLMQHSKYLHEDEPMFVYFPGSSLQIKGTT